MTSAVKPRSRRERKPKSDAPHDACRAFLDARDELAKLSEAKVPDADAIATAEGRLAYARADLRRALEHQPGRWCDSGVHRFALDRTGELHIHGRPGRLRDLAPALIGVGGWQVP